MGIGGDEFVESGGAAFPDRLKKAGNGASVARASFMDRYRMTPRQRVVFALLLEGAAPKEIGARLDIAHVTVRRHAQEIYRRCGVQGQRELLAHFANTLLVQGM